MNRSLIAVALALFPSSALAQAVAPEATAAPQIQAAPPVASAAQPAPAVASESMAVVQAPAAPATARAQAASTVFKREGFYIGFGVGGGSGGFSQQTAIRTYDGYFGEGREGGVALNFRLGAAITPKLLLGGNLGGWTASREYGSTRVSFTNVRISPEVTFYPLADQAGFGSGLYVRGGAGLGSMQAQADATSGSGASITSERIQGLAAHAGLGAETKLASRFFLGLGVDYHRGWLAKDVNTNQVEALLTFMWY